MNSRDALVEAIGKATEARAQVVSLAVVLAAYEAKTGKDTWRRPGNAARYFAFLAATGYELSDVEKLTQPKTPKTKPQAAKRTVKPKATANAHTRATSSTGEPDADAGSPPDTGDGAETDEADTEQHNTPSRTGRRRG